MLVLSPAPELGLLRLLFLVTLVATAGARVVAAELVDIMALAEMARLLI